MTPKKRKPKVSLKEEEVAITLELKEEELEAEIRKAEELRKKESGKQKEEGKNSKGIDMKENIEKIKTKEGVIGYILRNMSSASIDLKDPTKVIDYAVLSSSALEASEELSKNFDLGDAKYILVEGDDTKVLSFTLEENRVSIFMGKNVDHNRIYKELTS
jgi:predicted regulator of Ras-like GTPase activity (Roadblock/LC7/MglB family)